MFKNQPRIEGENKLRRYVHQPITIEHQGMQAEIRTNGRIKLTSVPKPSGDGMVEYDEIEIPASLVFKLSSLLRATRKIEFVAVTEVKDGDELA